MMNFNMLGGIALLMLMAACGGGGSGQEDTAAQQPPAEQQTPLKMIEYLVGEWEVVRTEGAENPEGQNRRLVFNSEAGYVMHEGEQEIERGTYHMNEQLNNLYLESGSLNQRREYEVEIQGDQMTLTPRNPAQGEQATSYVYRRAGPSSIPPDKTP